MINTTIKDISLSFQTIPTAFSPRYIDKGTLAMLDEISFLPNTKILDLGCGYGVIGIVAAHFTDPSLVYMIDNDREVLSIAKENVTINNVEKVHIEYSDGFNDFTSTNFDMIISHPPYHVDFSLPKHFIEKGFNRLKIGGCMYIVTKRRKWYENKFLAIFGGVRVFEKNDYFVFYAEKRQVNYANKKK